jgi:hypothetical protein
MLADELDDLAVAVSGQFVLGACRHQHYLSPRRVRAKQNDRLDRPRVHRASSSYLVSHCIAGRPHEVATRESSSGWPISMFYSSGALLDSNRHWLARLKTVSEE